jgi:membrane protease YdiL (CAAX protease family)
MLVQVFLFQFEKIKTNFFIFSLLVVTALGALYVGYLHDTISQAFAYLFIMWLCSFLTDLYVLKRPAPNDFEVRNPKRESIYFLSSVFLGFLFFYFRFFGTQDWEHTNGLVKLAVLPLILFVFPIALAILLLVLKYKPKDLGIRLQGFIPVIPIVLLSFITNRIVSPQSLTWSALVEEGSGIAGALFSGIILAGLSEEFFRFVGQTRLGALFQNKGMGWFITTLIWAFMHAPKWYSDDHDLTEALLGSIRIVPIGLMWGYVTHRTKSVLPSVLIHGTNVWGLQNF